MQLAIWLETGRDTINMRLVLIARWHSTASKRVCGVGESLSEAGFTQNRKPKKGISSQPCKQNVHESQIVIPYCCRDISEHPLLNHLKPLLGFNYVFNPKALDLASYHDWVPLMWNEHYFSHKSQISLSTHPLLFPNGKKPKRRKLKQGRRKMKGPAEALWPDLKPKTGIPAGEEPRTAAAVRGDAASPVQIQS